MRRKCDDDKILRARQSVFRRICHTSRGQLHLHLIPCILWQSLVQIMPKKQVLVSSRPNGPAAQAVGQTVPLRPTRCARTTHRCRTIPSSSFVPLPPPGLYVKVANKCHFFYECHFFWLHGYYLANRLYTLSLFRRTMAPLADRISVARMLLDFVCHSKWNVFVLGRPSHDDPSAQWAPRKEEGSGSSTEGSGSSPWS